MAGVDALFARALALEDRQRLNEALAQYEAILALVSDHADAWHNRGLLLARMGRLDEAERSHQTYASRCPQAARPWSNLADVRLARGRYGDALEALERIPDAAIDGPALVRRGLALSCLRRLDEARTVFAAARALFPIDTAAFVASVAPGAELDLLLSPESIYLSRCYSALRDCDWSGWDGYVAEMRGVASRDEAAIEPAVAFMALLAPLSGRERSAVARHVARRVERTVLAMPSPQPSSRARIRVGILSPDLRDHVVGRLLVPLFELIDRSRFEVFAYSLAADDGSPVRKRLHEAASGVRDLESLSDALAAAEIRRDDIDILIDACGHMAAGRFGIAAYRPARVQAAYAGFSGSLASSRVDFAIVDRVVAPDPGEWSEQLVYMPSTFYLYDFRDLPREVPLTRADYGLPQDAFVFCAFHNAHKITPDAFQTWMEILRGAPRSVLWFRALSDRAQKNLRAAAATHGFDPTRLVFAPFEPSTDPRYLARHRLGDLLLDAPHHNAITNACDALGAGLPVLTLRGTSMATRAGGSLLQAAGLPELIAPDRSAFVRTAVEIASDPGRALDYKRRLAASRNAAPLFDTAQRVREIENCLEEMLQVSDQSRRRL